MKLLVITDFDSKGSGYKNICAPLLSGLSELGHDIKVAGLMYLGEEHNYPFSVIPTRNVQEAHAIASNLIQSNWNPDVIVVALDIPVQGNLYSQFAKFGKKYVAITPLENGPLTMQWAVPLFNMDAIFFISELGKREAMKVGLTNVEHLQIGVDTESWRPATPDEKSKIREGLGIPQDAFVVLTVADNQERKNLWAGLESISRLKSQIDRPVRYVMVTRENNPYGWKIRDLVNSLGIQDEYIGFERGLPQPELWGLYALADVYLQPSKAEGLGLPVLDAMACGIPVVATDTGAMTELLENHRGYLIRGEYEIVDVWGNSRRTMIDIDSCTDTLRAISKHSDNAKIISDAGLEYVRSRTWDIPVKHFDSVIRKLFNE